MKLIVGNGKSSQSIEGFFKTQNIPYRLYEKDSFDDQQLNDVDEIIKSPGVRFDHPVLKMAKVKNIKISNEINFSLNFFKIKPFTIAVTGTNGKTTISTLIHDLLNNANIDNAIAGNIGIPLSSIADESLFKNNILILELSSFQLREMTSFDPEISIFTNFSPSHLDFHKSEKEYLESKLNISKKQSKNKISLFNFDDKVLSASYKNINSIKIPVSINDNINNKNAYFKDGNIFFENEIILNKEEIQEISFGNKYNFLFAINVGKILNIDTQTIRDTLINFKNPEFRFQKINSKINNRIIINDSKSTNAIALINAIKSSINIQNLSLIIGGKENNNLNNLNIPKNISKIFLYGESGKRLFNSINYENKFLFKNLFEVISYIKENESDKENILFSPGFQSYDQFKNFEERGKYFNKLILDFNL